MKPLRLFQIIPLGLLQAPFEKQCWNCKEVSQNMCTVLKHQGSSFILVENEDETLQKIGQNPRCSGPKVTLLRDWDASVVRQESAKSLKSLRCSVMSVEARESSYNYIVPTVSCSAGIAMTEHPQ